MRFTEFLLVEGDKSIAANILKQAENKVADDAADSDGKMHDQHILSAAKKLAKNEPNKTAIIEIIKMKLQLNRT